MGTVNIEGNVINGFTIIDASSSASNGIIIDGELSLVNIYKNKINDFSDTNTGSTISVNGILVNNGIEVNIYNNFISNLTATACDSEDAVSGIKFTNVLTNNTYKAYYNTIVLDGTSSGSNFGNNCIYHAANATAAISNLSLINNILVNNSTPKGTGFSVALRRTAADLENFDSDSNNNLYFVGTPSAKKLFYYDGTNSAQNLTQLTTILTPRETNSISENPVFVNLSTGDLHLVQNQNCKINGNGKNIALYSDDIDGDIRNGVTPEIGADEYDFLTSTYSSGAWDIQPAAGNDLVFNGDYNSAALVEGCNCVVNSGKNVILAPGGVLSLGKNLTLNGTATFNVQNNASLVQSDNNAVNTGSIKVDRTTSDYENFDYVYWSSPVVGATIGAPFASWRLNRAYEYVTSNFLDLYNIGSPIQTSGVPDSFDDNGDDWQNVSGATVMTPAKGYIVMTPYTAASTTTSVSFNGVPNNGIFNVPLALSANNSSNTDDFNLVGNPYPSALNADSFINANIIAGGAAANNISGTIYIWTHVGNVQIAGTNPGPQAYNFNANDYATYTLAGGVGTSSGSGSAAPTGKIASGQAFFVEAETTNNLVFNNSMRSGSYLNNQFFRTNNNATQNSDEKDRLRLNFKNVDNMFSQQLIGYFDNATIGYDYGYDGMVSQSQNYVSFYSLMPNNPELYRIQAQSSWDNSKTVALGYSSSVSGSSSISIGSLEGVFNLDSTNVYLQDNLLNVTHNLKQSPYVFNTAVGTFNARFVLKYVNTTLGTIDNTDYQKTVIVAKKDQQLIVKSAFLPIEKIAIYDLLGRKIIEKTNVNKNEFLIDNVDLNQQTIIVKVTLENGIVVNRKVVF